MNQVSLKQRFGIFKITAIIKKKIKLLFPTHLVSLVAQLVKNLPAKWEADRTWVRSLGWEDTLEKGEATYSSILAWRIPWTV